MSTSCSKTFPLMVTEPNWVRSILGCIVHLIPRLTCGERPYTDHAELAAAAGLPGNRDRDSGGPRPADADCHDRPGFILTASTTHSSPVSCQPLGCRPGRSPSWGAPLIGVED